LAVAACLNETRLAAEEADPSTGAPAPAVGAQEATTDSSARSTVVARRLWAGPDVDVSGAPSPDGRYLSYVDWNTWRLSVRDVATGESRPLTDPDQAGAFPEYSIFSPDSRSVAYGWFSGDRVALRVVGLDGSAPRTLVDASREDIGYLRAGAWSPDGETIAAIVFRPDGSRQLAMIATRDGSLRALRSFAWQYPNMISFSPDGRFLAYDFPPDDSSPSRDVYLIANDGTRETVVVRHPAHDILLGWAPDGRLIIGSDRGGTMSAWAIGIRDGRAHGAPALLKRDLWRVLPLGMTRQGSLVYGIITSVSDAYVAMIDPRSGRVQSTPVPITSNAPGFHQGVDWSPDGERVAMLTRLGATPVDDRMSALTILSLRGGDVRQTRPELGYINGAIRWAVDGRSILAPGRDKKGRQGLFRIDLRTGGTTTVLAGGPTHAAGPVRSPMPSPDGRTIFFHRVVHEPTTVTVIGAHDVVTNSTRILHQMASDGHAIRAFAVSGDGQQIAYAVDVPHDDGGVLFTLPAGGGSPREMLRLPGPYWINALAWSSDGRHLIFAKASGPLSRLEGSLWRIPADGGTPESLNLEMPNITQIRMHPDGRRIALMAGESTAEVWVMDIPDADAAPARTLRNRR